MSKVLELNWTNHLKSERYMTKLIMTKIKCYATSGIKRKMRDDTLNILGKNSGKK